MEGAVARCGGEVRDGSAPCAASRATDLPSRSPGQAVRLLTVAPRSSLMLHAAHLCLPCRQKAKERAASVGTSCCAAQHTQRNNQHPVCPLAAQLDLVEGESR